MRRRVSISPDAQDAVETTAEFLANEDVNLAFRFYDAIDRTVELLRESPEIGVRRTFRDSRLQDIRMWVLSEFPNYLVFYRVESDWIRIVHVLHAAEDYRRKLGP